VISDIQGFCNRDIIFITGIRECVQDYFIKQALRRQWFACVRGGGGSESYPGANGKFLFGHSLELVVYMSFIAGVFLTIVP
jgi:hypothetical protein